MSLVNFYRKHFISISLFVNLFVTQFQHNISWFYCKDDISRKMLIDAEFVAPHSSVFQKWATNAVHTTSINHVPIIVRELKASCSHEWLDICQWRVCLRLDYRVSIPDAMVIFPPYSNWWLDPIICSFSEYCGFFARVQARCVLWYRDLGCMLRTSASSAQFYGIMLRHSGDFYAHL